MTATLAFVLAGMLTAATPILFAALGEAVAERAGVLNLSVEGMMATGAAAGFVAATLTGSHAFGFLAGALAAAGLSVVFAALVLGFRANQVAAGLAVGVVGIGVAAFLGRRWEGATIAKLPTAPIPVLSEIPVLGPALFAQSVVVYAGLLLVPAIAFVMTRTKLGLRIRAVGENPAAAREVGIPVARVRLGCVAFGGAMAGIGGAFLAIAYTGIWAEGLVAGRGWIAVALVVFGSWLPWRIAVGAWIFGAISLLELSVQSMGIGVPSQLLAASPYLVTIAVLAAISREGARGRVDRPLALGQADRADT